MKKIALVHDYIKEYGGAERVLEVLHDMYPDAPIFTLVYCPQFLGPHKKRFENWDIRESWVGFLPFKHKFISFYRLIAPLVFKSFDFSKFDIVIVSSTGAYCPNMIKTSFKLKDSKLKKIKHICYCHTPPRYLYGYATAREWKKNVIFKTLGELANHFLRMVDFSSAQKVDVFIANSKEVKSRIEKFYRKDAVVVYPPVDIDSKHEKGKNSGYLQPTTYYLAGGRLARPKHFDLIIQACKELNVPLKIFGRGFAGYEEELRSKLKSTNTTSEIELLGEVNDTEKVELMRHAKAFIFAGEDEDFGIVPVEAMGVGTPVIAYKSGGVQETVIDNKTGVFFDKLSANALKEAINKFERLKIKPENCTKQAQKFSKENFEKGIKKIVDKVS